MNASRNRDPEDSPTAASAADDVKWQVAHTRPRCEKKLAEYCQRQGLATTLVCYKSVRKYRGKTVTFEKPLFPGYLFLQLLPLQAALVTRNRQVARLLEVPDQEQFAQQLADIQLAVESDFEVCVAPEIKPSTRVKIKYGPLRGIEGFVEQREGVTQVVLRLDFIGQAAAVKVEATDLEMI